MKSSFFRGMGLCCPLKDKGRFRGTCSLHLQRLRISQARNSVEQVARRTLLTLTRGFHLEDQEFDLWNSTAQSDANIQANDI
jgi:hypothetical protein